MEQIVLAAISDVADYVRCYEPVFLYMLAKKNSSVRQAELQKLRRNVENGVKRLHELDSIIEGLFEANLTHKISDERFMKMCANYEKEQRELAAMVEDAQKKLHEAEQKKTDLRVLLNALRDFTDVKQLTPELVNTLIERIEVHSPEKKFSHNNVKVDIYLTAAGLIDVPTEQEIQKAMDEIRQENTAKISA